jgi:hypothetical protein
VVNVFRAGYRTWWKLVEQHGFVRETSERYHGCASFVLVGVRMWYRANAAALRMERTKKIDNVQATIPEAGIMSCMRCRCGCGRAPKDDVIMT